MAQTMAPELLTTRKTQHWCFPSSCGCQTPFWAAFKVIPFLSSTDYYSLCWQQRPGPLTGLSCLPPALGQRCKGWGQRQVWALRALCCATGCCCFYRSQCSLCEGQGHPLLQLTPQQPPELGHCGGSRQEPGQGS